MRAAATLLLALLTATTTWADDVTLSVDSDIAEGTAGHYYVNMPATGTNTLTLSDATVTTFKIYDDGGKDGYYSNGCSGYLTLTAPTGYVLQLSGSIATGKNWDKLTVYDGSTTSVTKLLDAVSSTSDGTETAITTVVSSGQSMTLYFYSDGGYNYAGLDLTVTLVNPNAEYGITVNNASGGSVASDKSTAKFNDEVTLTATPSEGYLLSGLSVTDASNNAVAANGGWYTNNQATFTMPGSAVTVTPTFTNDLTNLYINMPAAGTKTATIPTGVQSFKVYDDGGASSNYSDNCSGTLTLTAPEGYVLQLSGSIKTQSSADYLTVYDNSAASGTKLLNAVSSTSSGTETAITTVVSSGQSMKLYFYSNFGSNYAGLDLTVTLVNPNAEYGITVGNATGGSVAATVGGQSASTAKENDVVTLTATPSVGYLFSGISVTDASGNAVEVDWSVWTNTATFTMPASAVTVTPTFTNDLTSLYVNMPKSGTKTATIPSGVQSFKVYDDGGASSNYSDNCSGYLTLTAPEGYVLQLSGSITTETNYDYLTVYDNSAASGTKLLDEVSSTSTAITTVASSGQSMTLYFYSDHGYNYAGLDLTVTLFSTSTEYAITVGNATGGSVAATVGGQSASTAKVNDVVTLTATPTNGYLLSDISVTDASSNAVAVAWDIWTNTATFTMPVSAVTVTPTFTNTWTADGGLYVNMPKSGTKTATIPSGVQSFKVYDDGGASGYYSNIYDGTLVLTAPAGYVLQLSGSITTETNCDKLTVYNGTSDSDPKLIDAVSSTSYGTETDITTVVSSGQSMTLYFNSDDIYSYAGLDLTVTLVPITYTVSFNANGGTGDTMAAQNFTYDAAQTLTANSYTRTGYTFAGWATTADGDVVYTDQQSVSNLTTEPNGNVELYAKWTPSGNISLTANAHDGNLWTTFYCGDASYTIDDAENACAYTAEVGTSEVVLHRLGKVIPQGTAVIIVGQDDEISMTISSETVDAMPANHLRGLDVRTATADVISSIVGADALYMMSKQGDEFGFFRYEGTNVPARKAFLALNNSQAALARGFQMVFDDETTGISTTDFTDYTDGADAWYSLDGRKLAGKPTQRGIYVNNGKKIVIK